MRWGFRSTSHFLLSLAFCTRQSQVIYICRQGQTDHFGKGIRSTEMPRQKRFEGSLVPFCIVQLHAAGADRCSCRDFDLLPVEAEKAMPRRCWAMLLRRELCGLLCCGGSVQGLGRRSSAGSDSG